MTIYLKQSTASQEVALGYFLDSTDGNTEETGLTIANTDIKLFKAGATTLADKNSGGATHISNGIYYAVLDATDTNTLGSLVIYCHPTGALATKVDCVVYPANVYDALIGGSDLLDVSTTQLAGQTVTASAGVTFPTSVASPTNITAGTITTATNVTTVNGLAANVITATSIASNAITSAKIATDAITSAQLAASAVTEIQTGLATPTNITAGVITTVGTVNALAANSVNASALATDAVTEIQSGLATSSALSTLQTSVNTLDDFVDTEVAAIKVVTDKLDTALVLDGAVYQYTANALELAPSGGLDAAGIRSAVGLASANLDTQLSTIDTVVDAVKAKTDSLTFTKANELDANIQSVNNVTVVGTGATGDEWGPV